MTSPEQQVDVVVIGSGSGGKAAALALAGQGRSVVVVERGRVGGECPYVACVPAKSLLLSARAGRSWPEAVSARDEAADHRRDDAAVDSLHEAGVRLLRGSARLTGPGRVIATDVDGEQTHLAAAVVVLGTGSRPVVPPVDGLADVATWTSDEALSADERPDRLIVLGGGAVGCELAQAFAGLGTEVHLVEVADQLLPAERPRVGQALAAALRDSGVHVHTGVEPVRAEAAADGVVVELADGNRLHADRVLVAGGREPVTEGLGLDTVRAELDDDGHVTVDARCRVLDESGTPVDGLYAVGDLTAESSYTHSATLQAEVVASDLADGGHDADYRAVPRVVYTDPAVSCVGVAEVPDDVAGWQVLELDLADVERATLWAGAAPGRAVHGLLDLVFDDDDVLVGAACVGPEADSWGSQLVLGVQLGVTRTQLRRTVQAFPAWSESLTAALDV